MEVGTTIRTGHSPAICPRSSKPAPQRAGCTGHRKQALPISLGCWGSRRQVRTKSFPPSRSSGMPLPGIFSKPISASLHPAMVSSPARRAPWKKPLGEHRLMLQARDGDSRIIACLARVLRFPGKCPGTSPRRSVAADKADHDKAQVKNSLRFALGQRCQHSACSS